MGHVQHKYTRTYFTKTNPDGSTAGYGVEGYEEFMAGKIREIDLSILERIDFSGRRVLEFGFGRGEAIKYALEHGAAAYEGVDFSEHAIAIATEFLEKHALAVPPLHHADALEFLKKYVPVHEAEKRPAFDVVLMLDFVEHVPRTELSEIMSMLRGVLSDVAVVAINTPAFRVDNDVIRDGLLPIDSSEFVDNSDFIEETAGMHCNKYTIISLQEFMRSCGYSAISEAHFYVPASTAPSPLEVFPAFRSAWGEAVAQGRALLPDWSEDVIEYAYRLEDVAEGHTFGQGRLKGVSLLLTDFYQQYFPAGEYDPELFADLDQQETAGKTIFDIGGFMGVSSLLFSQAVGVSGRVVCFEPNPWNRQRIRSNLSRNPELARQISLYGAALGDTPGNMEMLLSSNVDSGHSSTSQSVASHGTLSKEHLLTLGFYHQSVCVTTLDEFVQTTGIVPHILKVDIEGAEHLFLAGAEATIRQHRPVIYMEVHSTFCAWVCSQKLQRLSYSLRLLLEESDGRIMIRAEPQSASLPSTDSTSMIKELFDLLRIERQWQNKISIENHNLQQIIYDQKIKLRDVNANCCNLQELLRNTNENFDVLKNNLHALQQESDDKQRLLDAANAELCNKNEALIAAMVIVNHPVIKLQRRVFRALKKIFSS